MYPNMGAYMDNLFEIQYHRIFLESTEEIISSFSRKAEYLDTNLDSVGKNTKARQVEIDSNAE